MTLTHQSRVLLLDTSWLAYRAFYGSPTHDAVRGVRGAVRKLIKQTDASHVAACLDVDWRPQWRVDLINSYKTHRALDDGGEDMPAELAEQFPVVYDELRESGIPTVGVDQAEADDVIATLTRIAREAGAKVFIASADKDLHCLAEPGSGVHQVLPVRGQGLVIHSPEELAERSGLPSGDAYLIAAALRGDPSDGLPGVAGIGAKTAAQLAAGASHIGELLDKVDTGELKLSAKRREAVLESRDYLERAIMVVTPRDDLDLDQTCIAQVVK